MNLDNIILKVAEELLLPKDLVDLVFKSYWLFIKDTIQSLPLKEDIEEEAFNSIKTNFNVPSLGKLSCTYDRYKSIKKRHEYIKKLRKNNEYTSKKD